ncbi:hypothetical protein [Pararhodospirillum photometricum]|uniref:Uncharacterized protein n=1 Tax=Pararhodospirillum photometricum DSM 122 TaxID=1150469 RepID=H6SL11_PARPM|nr:hypothetical protein [Pararhodospirillum photometricum]CCG08676.1 unnamed protein product [Pararhodospirillum photometricum DSM 122]
MKIWLRRLLAYKERASLKAYLRALKALGIPVTGIDWDFWDYPTPIICATPPTNNITEALALEDMAHDTVEATLPGLVGLVVIRWQYPPARPPHFAFQINVGID